METFYSFQSEILRAEKQYTEVSVISKYFGIYNTNFYCICQPLLFSKCGEDVIPFPFHFAVDSHDLELLQDSEEKGTKNSSLVITTLKEK